MKNRLLLPFLLFFTSGTIADAQPTRDTTLTIKGSIIFARKITGGAYIGTGAVKVSGDMARRLPVILGETDIVKTVQLLPGINSGSEGFSGIYIRGGGPDENMIQLDGVPVYSAGHMLGLFSVFQGDAVRDFTLFKGAFPARYGGRSSGVLDVRTVDGNLNEAHGSIGLGMISDKFHIDGPFIKGKTSYSISGRGMHTFLFDGVLKAVKFPANYYFNDLHAKVTHRLGESGSIQAAFFKGEDILHYREDKDRTVISWGNTIGSLCLTNTWSIGLKAEILVAFSNYDMLFRFKSPGIPDDKYESGIRDMIAKVGFSYTSVPGHDFRFGIEEIRHSFMPKAEGNETSVYLEDKFGLFRTIQVEAGGRLVSFHAAGKTWWSPEPRIAVTCLPWNCLKIQASYSRMSQYIHLLSSSQVVLPIDQWIPVTSEIPPVTADQFSGGVSIESNRGFLFSMEAYLKMMNGVTDYKEDLSVATGKGRSKGLEFFFSKISGKSTGWIGYTLSWTDRRFPDGSINEGKWFPYRYDIRHNVSVVSNTNLGHGWDASATWRWSTGGALRNGDYRLPPSHRLDVCVNHHKAKRKGERVWNISVYNAYNRKNPNLVFETYDEGEDGPGSPKIISILPVIPSVSYIRLF